MRANDMVHGGQGAPLVPAYHAALAGVLPAAEAAIYPVFVNIGGISNVTYVPRRGDPLAFDSGPGNALIDQWVAREGGMPYDADGAIASEGGVIAAVVARYLESLSFQEAARNHWIATILRWISRAAWNWPTGRAPWPR